MKNPKYFKNLYHKYPNEKIYFFCGLIQSKNNMDYFQHGSVSELSWNISKISLNSYPKNLRSLRTDSVYDQLEFFANWFVLWSSLKHFKVGKARKEKKI